MLTLRGQLSYRLRIALPPDSRAVVAVQEAGAKPGAGSIAQTRIDLNGRQVPIFFELTVPRSKFADGKQYELLGTISSGGRVGWVTDPVPVTPATGIVELGTLNMTQVQGSAVVATTFRARGNEPGWSLTLDDNTMTLVTDYGSASRVMPTPPVQSTADGRRYATTSDGKDVVVTISDRPCADNMSGMPFPATVVVQLDGRELTGCGGEPVSLLTGNEWVVEDIDRKGIIDNSRASLNFGDDGRLYGRASCNTYSAKFTLTGEGLSVTNVVTTEKACAPSLMDQEARFLAALQSVQRFEIGATGELILSGPEGQGIVARR